jgi:hypothetical protein
VTAVDQAGPESVPSSEVHVPLEGWEPAKQAVTDGKKPEHYVLHECFPNPFNPSTRIKFDLPSPGDVSLALFDLLGRKIADLTHAYYESGYHEITWDGSDVAGGVYFVQLTVTDALAKTTYSRVNRLVLVK